MKAMQVKHSPISDEKNAVNYHAAYSFSRGRVKRYTLTLSVVRLSVGPVHTIYSKLERLRSFKFGGDMAWTRVTGGAKCDIERSKITENGYPGSGKVACCGLLSVHRLVILSQVRRPIRHLDEGSELEIH